jgi:hypothetical protein
MPIPPKRHRITAMTDWHVADNDILENRRGTLCAHCGFQLRGSAEVDGQPVCHTSPPFPDCYRLVTVYHELLGSRRPGGRLVPSDPADWWYDDPPEVT